MTLPPYGFYWFSLSTVTEQPAWSTATSESVAEYYTFVLRDGLAAVLIGQPRSTLEQEILPPYVAQRRWFQNKGTTLPTVRVQAALPISPTDNEIIFCVLDIEAKDTRERYALPLTIAWEDAASSPFEASRALARVRRGPRIGLLTDGFASPRFARAIVSALANGTDAGIDGFIFTPAPAFTDIPGDAQIEWPGAEQSNSTLIIGRIAVIKLFRRLLEGVHPESEMVRELTERGFTGIGALMGDVVYASPNGLHMTVAVVQRFVENQGDGFRWSIDQLGRLFENQAMETEDDHSGLEAYENFIRIAGRRLGQMHAILAQESDNPDFAPQSATAETLNAWGERLRGQLDSAMQVLAAQRASTTQDSGKSFEQQWPSRRDEIFAVADHILEQAAGLKLTRIHGDLHLGQLLISADDVVIIDFEGEPLKTLAERRAKDSPLRDVASMLRSFDYVASTVARSSKLAATGQAAERASSLLQQFDETARAAFLSGYGEGRGRQLDAQEIQLISIFALEKAAYEIVYEVRNRPDWIDLPLAGFIKLANALVGERQ
jgi:maltose alpha-D-glucosyltransferase/alpha-amylase